MNSSWVLADGMLVVRGPMREAAPHWHPAVQVMVSGAGSVEVCDRFGEWHCARAVVVDSGIRHALRNAGESLLFSMYLVPGIAYGALLGRACRANGTGGVWAVDAAAVSEAAGRALESDDLAGSAALLLRAFAAQTGALDAVSEPHPLAMRALTAVTMTLPAPTRLSAIAERLNVTPDHLGRLFNRQFGASFSSASRWMRLLHGLAFVSAGHSITDAAHMAGFADAAHATRTCRELAGAPPSLFSGLMRDASG